MVSSIIPSRILGEEKNCFSGVVFFSRGRQVEKNSKEQLKPWELHSLSYITNCSWGEKKGKGLTHLSFLSSISFPKSQRQERMEPRFYILEGALTEFSDLFGVVILCRRKNAEYSPLIFKFEEIIKTNLLWFSPCSNYNNTEHL